MKTNCGFCVKIYAQLVEIEKIFMYKHQEEGTEETTTRRMQQEEAATIATREYESKLDDLPENARYC